MTVLLNNEITNLLRTHRLPARLTMPQVAAILGFQPHDIPVLTSKKLMRALGKPAANTTKYYAAREIESLANDPAWLSKATQSLSDHWRTKNIGRSQFAPVSTLAQNNEAELCGSHLPETWPAKS